MTVLYRLWTKEHALLYVGVTDDLDVRLQQHEGSQPWWSEVDQVSQEEFPSRFAALNAEARAIFWEMPRHNKVGSARYSADWEAIYHAREDEWKRAFVVAESLFDEQRQEIADLKDRLAVAGAREASRSSPIAIVDVLRGMFVGGNAA